LLRRALPAEATIHEVATRTSKKLFATSKLSRIFAVAQAPRAAGLRDLATLQQDIVVLENLGISGNIGAIIRTAVALGVGGVVLLDSDTEVYDRRLIRASRGQVFSLPVVKATQEELLAFCRQHGWKLLVTDPQASYLVHDIASLQGRLAIVFGNEKKGCSGALLKAASLQIKIPTDPLVESLNVSAAAAITLFHRSKSNLCPLAP
ncbi:MAG: RNA methyltransferase, partial [Deinococcota bacterium]|nr:RNA methyltransferase [Deinococcota bacterium]